MGNLLAPYVHNMKVNYHTYRDPDSMPNIFNPPKYDQMLGFPEGRKERVSYVTLDEMKASGLPEDERDYCAHLNIAFRKCRKEHPYTASTNCDEKRKELYHCWDEDRILRLMEYERERRLMEREKRKSAAAHSLDG